MDKKEKVEFILEQMRLCLAKKDFVRTQIISKKISTKYFDEKDTHVSRPFLSTVNKYSISQFCGSWWQLQAVQNVANLTLADSFFIQKIKASL